MLWIEIITGTELKQAYRSLTTGEGKQAESAVRQLWKLRMQQNVTDEFVVPTVITENGKPVVSCKGERLSYLL